MTLYELTDQWAAVLMLAEDGADAEAVENALADIGGEIEEKADGYAKVIKQLEGEADMVKAEKERLYLKETALRNHSKSMKQRLEEAMVRVGKPKFKTDLFSFGIQKNAPSVAVEDEARLMEWAEKNAPDAIKTTVSLDKKRLMELLKGGTDVKYAKLQQSESLRIR